MECEGAAGANLFSSTTSDPEIAAALLSFEQAFFAALKLNWEYALNGVASSASDANVLVHTIYLWNRAHEPGAGFDITPSTAAVWAPNGTACDGTAPPWYAAILANLAGNSNPPDGVLNPSTKLLHINTGARKDFSLGGVAILPMGRAAASVRAPRRPQPSPQVLRA